MYTLFIFHKHGYTIGTYDRLAEVDKVIAVYQKFKTVHAITLYDPSGEMKFLAAKPF